MVVDAATGRDLIVLPPPTRSHDAYLSTDGREVTVVESNGVVTRYDVASGAIMARATLAGAADEEFGMAAVSPDGRRAAAVVGGGMIRILPDLTAHPKRVVQLPGYGIRIGRLAFSPDGRLIAAGGAVGLVRVWNVESGQLALAIPVEGMAAQVMFSEDGHRLFALCEESDKGSVAVFDGTPQPAAKTK